jgi:hypothetical protein
MESMVPDITEYPMKGFKVTLNDTDVVEVEAQNALEALLKAMASQVEMDDAKFHAANDMTFDTLTTEYLKGRDAKGEYEAVTRDVTPAGDRYVTRQITEEEKERVLSYNYNVK